MEIGSPGEMGQRRDRFVMVRKRSHQKELVVRRRQEKRRHSEELIHASWKVNTSMELCGIKTDSIIRIQQNSDE